MVGERGAQPIAEHRSHRCSARHQLLAAHDLEHLRARRARRVVAGEREVHEAAALQHIHHLVARGDGTERHVPTAQPLAAHDDVGLEGEVLVAEVATRAAVTGHHLVGDEQHVVLPAQVGDRAPVLVAGGEACAGRAGHRLGDEPGDGGGILLLEHLRHLLGVVPRHLRERQQQRLVALLTTGVAAHRHRARGHAVVAGMPADHLPPIGTPLCHLVRAGEADGRVGALAAAAGEEHVVEPVGEPVLDQFLDERQSRRSGPQRHHVAHRHRRRRSGCHLGATPADVAHDRARCAVEDALAGRRDEVAALAGDDGGERRSASRWRHERVAAEVVGWHVRGGHRMQYRSRRRGPTIAIESAACTCSGSTRPTTRVSTTTAT